MLMLKFRHRRVVRVQYEMWLKISLLWAAYAMHKSIAL